MADTPDRKRRGAAALRCAYRWFAVERETDGILRIWEPHVSRLFRANMFLVHGAERDLLVDAGMGVASLRRFIAGYTERPVTLLVTHAHVDHVGSAAEFSDEILMHPLEAPVLSSPSADWSITFDDYPPTKRDQLRAAGFDASGLAIAALPHEDYDPEDWHVAPTRATHQINDGDLVDLGDRRFRVLHLPGHSPGSIGLWEEETRTLIGGDAIYDGLIIDTLPESDPAAYADTMRRIRGLGARIVHGGHRESFGPVRVDEIVEKYLAGR